MVISYQSATAVRIGADYADCPDILFFQRKDAVILQKHKALCRGTGGCLHMLRAFQPVISNPVIPGLIKQSQQKPGGKQPFRRLSDFLLRHQSVLAGFQQVQIGIAAVDITAILQCHSCRFLRRVRHHMMFMKVPDCPAVRDIVPLKAPLFPQDILYQGSAAAAGFPIGPVIGAHHRFHIRFFHQFFKSGKIGFV